MTGYAYNASHSLCQNCTYILSLAATCTYCDQLRDRTKEEGGRERATQLRIHCAILLLGGSVIKSLGLSKKFGVIPLEFGPEEKSRPVRFSSPKPPLLIG